MNITNRLLAGAQKIYEANAAKRAEEKAAALAALEAAKKKKAGGDAGQGSGADTLGTGQVVTLVRDAETPSPRLCKAQAYDILD